jgi:hypothetical protein
MMDPSQAFHAAASAYIGHLLRHGRVVSALVTAWRVAVIRAVLWLIPGVADLADVRNNLVLGARMFAKHDANAQQRVIDADAQQRMIAAKDAEIADLRRRIAALREGLVEEQLNARSN